MSLQDNWATTSTAPAAAPAPATEPGLAKGQLVTHTYEGGSGPVTQTGAVLEVDANGRASVGWFAGVSGPIDPAELSAL